MTTKSKAEPTRRKSKSVSRPKAIHLTSVQCLKIAREKWWDELFTYFKNAPEAERRIIGPIVPDYTNMKPSMRDIQELLGKSIEKYKVIPFPIKQASTRR